MLITIVFLIFIGLSRQQEDLVFNRIRVTSNVGNQASVRMHIQSRNLPLLHAVLRFSSPVNVQHNALLIAQSTIENYRSMIDEARLKILINTRGINKLLSYVDFQADTALGDANRDGVADRLYELIQSTRLFGPSPSVGIAYDGVLLLDLYSGLWQEYNLAIFDRNTLRLRFALYQEADVIRLAEEREFHMHVRVECNMTIREDKCFVTGTEIDGLVIDQVHYPLLRLLIDLDSAYNLLPSDLFVRWSRQDESDANGPFLNITWQNKTLQLNRQFRYAAHESNLVILGADLLHHFPYIIYSVPDARFDIFAYAPDESNFDHHESIEIVLIFFNFLLLVCLFLWGTSYNYLLSRYIIRYGRYARSFFPFAFKQVLYEIATILFALIIICTTCLIVGGDYADQAYHRRKQCLVFFILCQAGLLFLVVVSHPESRKRAFRHYLSCKHTGREEKPYWSTFSSIVSIEDAEALYVDIVKSYHDPLVRVPTQTMIMRNLLFVSVNLSSLILLLNFYTATNDLCLLLMLLLSLAQLYYHVKYLAVGVLYLSLMVTPRQWQAQRTLLLFMALELVALFLYVTFSYETIFVAYFDNVNSTYPRVVVDAYLLTFLTVTMYTSVLMVATVFDNYIDPLLDKLIYS
jgi:hypothetical protein